MEVRESASNVSSKGEPEPPVQGDVVVLKDIVQTSFWSVFRDDSNVRRLDSSSNELAEVWMVNLSTKNNTGNYDKMDPISMKTKWESPTQEVNHGECIP
jgi:hypothetical protein